MDSDVKLKPYPYQEWGIEQELKMKRCINGDDMGLGKTLQAIVAIERAKATPCLVICPSALKINWAREILKFTNLRPLILSDANREAYPYYIGSLNLYDVLICNYESLAKFFVVSLGDKPLKLKNFVFQKTVPMLRSIIIDESARVKDPSTRQAKIVMGLCQGKEYIFELTGTPIVNDPKDLATQIAILGRIKDFGGYSAFLERYTNGNFGELQQKIKETLYFRREKEEVLKDLPELTRTFVPVEIPPSVREEYDICLHDLLTFLKEYKQMDDVQAKKKMRMKALIRFMNLRAISGRGKAESVIDFLGSTAASMVVFAEHRDIVSAIKQAFPNETVTVTGSDNAIQKQYAIDSFQRGEKRIIICSIRAAGVGITLTAASNVLFVELPWTYSDLAQCEARCHRNGQKNAVTSWIMIGQETIDDRLYKKIVDKKSLLSRITGATDSATFEDEKAFDELISLLS